MKFAKQALFISSLSGLFVSANLDATPLDYVESPSSLEKTADLASSRCNEQTHTKLPVKEDSKETLIKETKTGNLIAETRILLMISSLQQI